MPTVVERLATDVRQLIEDLCQMLGPNVSLRNINDDFQGVVYLGAPYVFSPLTIEKRRLQSNLLERHNRFSAIVRALMRAQTDAVRGDIDQNLSTLRGFIERGAVWYQTTDQVKAAAFESTQNIVAALSGLYDAGEGGVIFVPDTNALLHSPSFQEPGVVQTANVTGVVACFMGLAYSLYLLDHNVELQERLVRRLKTRRTFKALITS